MKQNPIILDITSSDDEIGFDDSSTADNFDWVSNLLEHSTHDSVIFDFSKGVLPTGDDDDDEDDVVVVGEVFAKPKRKKVLPNDSRCLGFDDVVDDDCVVLNCDPEKPPEKETAMEGEGKGSDLDSDDLLIIGEKGQVACRDYPHSRHLCAKFPFDSTPHESHCDLCHCYVCDTLAPCAFWGSGVSTLDHCSSTDKYGYWETERKRIRQLKNPSIPIAKPVADSLFRLPHSLQASSQPTPVQSSASTGGGVHSSFGLPNIITISQGRNPRANLSLQRKRFQSPEIVGQLLRSCNSNTQSLRTSSSTPSLVSSRPLFKRPGIAGRTRMVNLSVCVPRNKASSVSCWQQLLKHPLVAEPTKNNSTNLTKSSRLDTNISSSLPLVSSVSPMQGYNSPLSITPTSRFQGYHQSNGLRSDSPWVYSSGSQPQNGFSPGFHSSTYNAPNSVTRNGQQSSGLIQNVPGPNLPPCNTSELLRSITLSIPQTSEATQNGYSPGFHSSTYNAPNNVTRSGQQSSGLIQNNFGPNLPPRNTTDVLRSVTLSNPQTSEATQNGYSPGFHSSTYNAPNSVTRSCQQSSGLVWNDHSPILPPCNTSDVLRSVTLSIPRTSEATQNGYSPGFHSSTYNAPDSVTRSGQQSSGLVQNDCGPNLPPCNTSDMLRSVTLSIPQTSEATQNIYSSDFLCNTSDSMKGIVAQRYEKQHSIEKNPQVQGATPGDTFLSPLDHIGKESLGAIDSSALDFDLDAWLTENDPILDAQDGSGLYHTEDQPSPPPVVDAGMLYFDVDTSWNGLAQ